MVSESTKHIIKILSLKSQKMVDDNTVTEKIYFIMSANSADFKLLEFISNFKDVLKIEKVLLEDHIYILSIDGDKVDELNDIDKIFRDYESEMRKRIIKDKSVAERHHLDFFITFGEIDFDVIEKAFDIFNKMKNYRESAFKQVEYYASVSDDVLFDETAKMFSSFSSVSYDAAYKMTQSIQKSVDDLFDKYPYLGVFHISSNEVFSASDILDDIEFLGRVDHGELYQKESLLYEFLSKIESNKSLFYKVFYRDDFLYKVLELAKKGAEIDEFKIKGIDKNSTKEQFEDFNDRMRKLIASSQLENKDAITGRKVFDFLDYCNVGNYFDNEEVGIIREIADIFMAQRAAQYKQKLLTILDEKFNYGRVLDMSVDDVKDVIELLEYDSGYKKKK